MIKVTIVYEEPEQLNDLIKFDNVEYTLLDQGSIKQRKKAFLVKSHYAARLCPFSVVFADDKAIKVFYTEDTNVITALNEFTPQILEIQNLMQSDFNS